MRNLKWLIAGLGDKEVYIPSVSDEPSAAEIKELLAKQTKLLDRKAKLKEDIDRKNRLKTG